MKKALCAVLSLIIAATSLASCMQGKPRSTVTSSDGLEKYGEFLESRLGDALPENVTLTTEHEGYDMSDFADDGFITRAIGGDVVICGKTEEGVDRGVRDFVSYGNADSYSKVYNEGFRVKKLTLANFDISEYAVVIPEDANDNVNFAAENIRDYTKKACGALLEVTTEERPHMIRFVPDADGALGDDGFTITTSEGQMSVEYGRYRGALNGALEFLEAYMGWKFLYKPYRYYYAGASGAIDYLYENENLVIPVGISDTQIPSMPYRDVYDGDLYGDPRAGEEYAYKIKYNGEGTTHDPKFGHFGLQHKSCHGLWNATPVRNFITGKYESQPCFTDEEVIEVISDWVLDYAEDETASGKVIGYDLNCIDISGFDSSGYCTCNKCLSIVKKDGSNSGTVLYMANEVARAVDSRFPGLYVSILAYNGCNKPPKSTVPEKNVHVSYCFYTNPGVSSAPCGNHCYDGSECTYNTLNDLLGKEFEKWCEITTRVSVWMYGEFYFGCALSPEFDVLRKNIKYLTDHGCYGIFYLNGLTNNGADFWTLMSYLCTKLMWNADMSEEEYYGLIREYCKIVYGEESGELIYEYLGMMERARHMVPCYIQIRSGPFSRLSKEYYEKNYVYMNSLFEEALSLAPTSEAYELIEKLRLHEDFVGISACWDSMYVNGTEESRRFISERYRDHWEKAVKHNLILSSVIVDIFYPTENMDFEKSPYDYINRAEW